MGTKGYFPRGKAAFVKHVEYIHVVTLQWSSVNIVVPLNAITV